MKTVILQSHDGAHLGFLLCAIPAAEREGDCIFVIIPDQAEMLEAPEVKGLLQRKEQGESQIELTPDRRSAVISTEGFEEMFVELDANGEGQWGYVVAAQRIPLGQASAIHTSGK